MAKKNFQEMLGSSKARQDKFDFDFDEKDSPFSNFDPGSGGNTNSKNNRDPILQARQGVSAALSSAYSTFIPGLSNRISQNMPESAKFAGEVGTFTSDVMYMGTKLQQDLAPTISQLKRAGRTLAPRIKQFLPEFAQKKYDSLMSDGDDRARANVKASKEATESSAITASLDSIFSTQMNAQAEIVADQKADTMLNRALTSKQHSESFQQLQAIRAGSSFHQTFIQTIQIPFMKKDLELKYRHFFVARDSLAVMQGLAKITEQKLEQIRHNSSLPDIQKMTKWEGVKEAGLQRFGNIITNWQTNMLRKLQSRVLDPFREGVTMAGDAAEMMADVAGTMDSIDGVKGAGAQAGGLIGMLAGSQASKKAGKFLLGDKYGSKGLLSNKAASLDNLFKNLKTRTALKVQDMADEREGSFLGEMLSLIAPDLRRGAGKTTNTMLKDPNETAPFTNAVSLSITTIMPGYLAKMTKLLEEISTGKSAEELVFDRDSNDFITVSTLQKKFTTEAFGSLDSRKSRMSSAIGTMRGVYKAETGDDDFVSFDQCIPDLMKFITNSAMAQFKLRPAIIREYSGIIKEAQAGDDDNFDIFKDVDTSAQAIRYMRTCFNGVEHTEELCILLTSLLYNSDGIIDNQTYSTLDNVIIDQMMQDGHLEVLNKYLGKLGHARHLKGVISSSGSSFVHNDDIIKRSMLSGISGNSESFQKSVSMHTDSSAMKQAELKQTVSFSEILDDPEWNTGVLGKIISRSREFIGDHEDGAIKTISDWKSGAKDVWEQDILPAIPKELVDWSKQWAPKAHTKIVELNSSIKSTMDSASKRAEQSMKHARLKEERGKVTSSELQALDPFFNQGQPTTAQSTPRGMNPYAIAAFTGGSTGFQFPVMSATKNDEITPVRLTNIQEVTSALTKVLGTNQVQTVRTTSEIDGGSTVGAIQQFENTFKEYAEKQSAIPELLNKLLDISGAMSTQLDTMIGNTTGTIKKAFGWVKNSGWDFIKKVPGTAIKYPWMMTKWSGKQAGRALDWGTGGLGAAKDWAMPRLSGAWDATKKGIGTAAGVAGSVVKGGFDLSKTALLGGLGGLGLTSDVLAGKLATGAQWLRDQKDGVKTTLKGGITGLKKSISNKWKDKVFLDIYLKDKIDPGKPLLSKNKQMEGVCFVDSGKKLLTTYSIDKPIMDPETKDILVTQQDIDHGLVDVDNKSIFGAKTLTGKLLTGTVGLLGKGLSKGKDFLKDVMAGKNPFLGMMGGIAGLGLDGIRAAGRGAGFMLKKIFGVSESINAEDLKKHVGDKLDTIIELLQKRFTGDQSKPTTNAQNQDGPKPGDDDGDGKRDSIYQDRLESKQEKEIKADKKEQRGFYATMKSIKDKLVGGEGKEKKGILGTLMGLLGAGGLLGMAKNIFGTLKIMGTGIFGILKFVGNIGKILMSVIPFAGKALSWGIDKIGNLFNSPGAKSLLGKAGNLAKGAFSVIGGLLGIGGGGAAAAGVATTAATTAATGVAGTVAAGTVGSVAGTAATAAAGGVGTKLLTGAGIRAAGGMILRGAGAAAGAVIGGSTAAVIGTGLLAAGAVDYLFFDGKYSQHMFNYLGIGTDDFAEARCKLYGVDTSFKFTNVFGGSTLRQLIKLEELTHDIAEGKEAPLTDSDLEIWTNRFDLDNGDPQQVKFWVSWYKQRFIPIFKLYCAALQKEGIQFKNAYDAPTELKNKILGQIKGEAALIVKEFEMLVPTPAAYNAFKKKYEETKNDKSAGAMSKNQAALASQDASSEKAGKTVKNTDKYNMSASEAGALAAANKTEEKVPDWANDLKSLAGSDPAYARMMRGNVSSGKTTNGFPTLPGSNSGGAVTNTTGSGSSGGGGGPVDMSNIPPSAKAPSGTGAIGSYVAKHESGKEGSAAIGFDTNGGTSYGTYQLSSRMKSLHEFVNWCSKEAPEVYKRLSPLLGQANTGSRQGAFPDEWRRLVKEGKITYDLEYKYYLGAFYQNALNRLNRINPEAATMVKGNRALQEIMWSTSVQHGPGEGRGAAGIFAKTFKPGIKPEDYMRAIYGDRSNRFGSSTQKTQENVKKRFQRELGEMLALNGSPQGSAPADPNAKQSTTTTPSAEGSATPGGDGATTTAQTNNTTSTAQTGAADGGGGGSTVSVTASTTPGGMANSATSAGASEGGGGGATQTTTTASTTPATQSAPASEQSQSGNKLVELVTSIASSLTELVNVSKTTPGLLEKILEMATAFGSKPAQAAPTTASSHRQADAVNRPQPFVGDLSTAKLRRQ